MTSGPGRLCMRAIGVAVAAFLLLGSAEVRAAQQDQPSEPPVLNGNLERAFDGPAVDLAWTTHVLTLANMTESDLDLTVSLTQEPATRIVRQERIARRAIVRLQLYAPNLAILGSSVDCEVRDSAGRQLLRRKIETPGSRRWSYDRAPVVLALTQTRPTGVPSNWNVQTCREALFPQRSIGLQGVTAILMRDYRLEMLIPSQMDALLEWITNGGLLILYPGPNRAWLTSDGVRQIASIQLRETTMRQSLEKVEEWFGALRSRVPFAFQEITNGRPLLDTQPPVAVEYRRGHGRVVVVPFDLDSPPFDNWPGKATFLEGLAAPQPLIGLRRFDPVSPEVTAALSGAVNALPPFPLLLGLAVSFIVLIGPANYLVLRRVARPQLLLASIPAMSAAFVLVVVATGYVLRGASTVTWEVTLLEARNGDPWARQTRVLSLFSPASRTYSLACPGSETALSLEHDAAVQSGGWREFARASEAALRIDQDRGWILRECAFAQWQARVFVGRSSRALGRGVRFHLDDESLRVSNGSPWRIVRGFAVEGRRVGGTRLVPFGEVQAGADRSFAAPAESAPLSSLGLSPLEQRILQSWLADVTGHALLGRVALCVLDSPVEPIRIDAARSSSSERVCLLQIVEGDEP